jgi:rhodanese-related sulfurtransferase
MNSLPPRSPLVREIGFIVVLSVALSLTYNAFSAKGLPLVRVAPAKVEVADSVLFSTLEEVSKDTMPHAVSPATKVVAPEHEKALKNPDSVAQVVKKEKEEKQAALKVITLEQLKRLMLQKRGVLLDARSQEDFAKGHIKGARNIFAEEVEKYFEELVQIPRDTLVIIYCNNADCHLGRSLAEFMETINFTKLYLYDDGWDGWVAAKMPIDTTAAAAPEVKP